MWKRERGEWTEGMEGIVKERLLYLLHFDFGGARLGFSVVLQFYLGGAEQCLWTMIWSRIELLYTAPRL